MKQPDDLKIKIIYVITKSNFGGAQRYIFDLATNLPSKTFDVSVALGGEGVLIQKLEKEYIPVIRIPALQRDMSLVREIAAFLFLYRTFRDQKPDVVHLNSSKAGGLGALAARLAGVKKIIFTAHGWPFKENRNLLAKALIWIASYVTALLCTDIIVIATPELRSAQQMPFVGKKTTLIHNGIDPFPLISREEARNALGIKSPSEFWIGTIAELHPNKNLSMLIEAIANTPDTHLCIIGDGEEKKTLQEQIAHNNLGGRVILAGFIDNARTYLHAFDIFVLPSKKEGLPYVLLEAGFALVPIVASNVGGVADIIIKPSYGALTTPTTQEFTRAIKTLKKDYTLGVSNSKNLKEYIQAQFSIEKMVAETTQLYK